MNINWLISRLKKEYGAYSIFLNYKTKMQLLVAVILSAQTTDKQVNKITKNLFKKYKNPENFANARINIFQKEINSIGLYKIKAKNIIKTAKKIITKYDGKVPNNMADLIKLNGVGRKTANIILSQGFGKMEGIAVDTHVKRLSKRLGLTKSENPLVIEKDLIKQVNKKDWYAISTLLISHGRNICESRKPKCDKCILNKQCKSAFSFPQFK